MIPKVWFYRILTLVLIAIIILFMFKIIDQTTIINWFKDLFNKGKDAIISSLFSSNISN